MSTERDQLIAQFRKSAERFRLQDLDGKDITPEQAADAELARRAKVAATAPAPASPPASVAPPRPPAPPAPAAPLTDAERNEIAAQAFIEATTKRGGKPDPRMVAAIRAGDNAAFRALLDAKTPAPSPAPTKETRPMTIDKNAPGPARVAALIDHYRKFLPPPGATPAAEDERARMFERLIAEDAKAAQPWPESGDEWAIVERAADTRRANHQLTVVEIALLHASKAEREAARERRASADRASTRAVFKRNELQVHKSKLTELEASEHRVAAEYHNASLGRDLMSQERAARLHDELEEVRRQIEEVKYRIKQVQLEIEQLNAKASAA
jgi:hypothetical protein